MAKGKEVMVLVSKASYTRGKTVVVKGQSISKATFDALPKEHKLLFTDVKTAAKVLKRKVKASVEEEEDETTGGTDGGNGDEPNDK